MARKTKQQLEKIKNKYKVDQLWSWSKYNAYKNSIYEYFLKYILKQKEDRCDGIYGTSGGGCHEILEKFYSKDIKFEEMLSLYEDYLFNYNMSELKYNRSNDEKNAKIAEKYEYCIRNFFKNHNIINKKVEIERFVIIQIGKFIFQGYIDFLFKDGDDFVITDWKTSSIYTGKKIDKEKGQLVLYAEALRQLGIALENIKIRWNFLKYVTIETPQANGEIKERNISRHEIGESLKSNAKMWLKKEKLYSEEEIDAYLDMMVNTNSIDYLPENIKNKYVIKDCYVYIPFTIEEINSLKEDIVQTIVEISQKEVEYSESKDEKIWWEEITDGQSYYFANLSGYSAKLHKPYAEYLDKLNAKKELNKDSFNKNNNIIEESDMSWLDEL